MKTLNGLAIAATTMALAGASQAALIDRGGGMIYDTTRNITWMADLNYAKTSGHTGFGVAADGAMVWLAAEVWASNLEFGGFNDWRMPTLNTADTSCTESVDPLGGFPLQYFGFNCAGGELSGLFVTDLGYNNAGSGLITSDDTAEQVSNQALFSNLQPSAYWSGTEFAPFPVGSWYFDTRDGAQNFISKGLALYAVAVRDGDVPLGLPEGSVPEPRSLALVLLALGAAGVSRRTRPR